jgi:hypothetical protein
MFPIGWDFNDWAGSKVLPGRFGGPNLPGEENDVG